MGLQDLQSSHIYGKPVEGDASRVTAYCTNCVFLQSF